MLKKRKRIIIITSAILVAAIAVGSTFILKKDESYALKVGETVIPPQTYNAYLIQKTLLARSRVMDTGASFMESFMNGTEIDGTPVSDWIEAKVREQVIYDYVIKSEWDKQEDGVSGSEQERLDTYLNQQWEAYKDIYENNQCDRETFNAVHQSFLYNALVFDDFTAKNPLGDTEPQLVVQAASAKYFIINKYSTDGRKYTQEETDQLKTLVEDYMKELKDNKSIDEIYKNHLIRTGGESSAYRPISASVISNDNTAYTSKIPNFVNALMEAEVGDPFYIEDEYFITIGIRQKDENQKTVQQAYTDNAVKKVQKEKFDEYIEGIIKKVTVKKNNSIIKKYAPESVKLPEAES